MSFKKGCDYKSAKDAFLSRDISDGRSCGMDQLPIANNAQNVIEIIKSKIFLIFVS